MADYAKIFKAYDIRGVVPDDLDEGAAEAIGAAFARLTGAPTADDGTRPVQISHRRLDGAEAEHDCHDHGHETNQRTGLAFGQRFSDSELTSDIRR